MRPTRLTRISSSLAIFLLCRLAGANPYSRPPCKDGEVELTDSNGGVMCLPECSGKGGCPSFGGHATPSCALSAEGKHLCVLECSSDSDCDYDGGASCNTIAGDGGPINVCLYGWKSFWAWHVFSAEFTGAANKDLGDEACDVGFVAYYCFGQQPAYSKYNSEEHIDGNVIEYLRVTVETSDTGEYNWGQYLSCCPPGSKTNQGNYYRCNTWTGQDNDNCHTEGLPWNDGKESRAGAIEVPGAKGTYMYSFPAEGEGIHWRQGQARRIFAPDMANAWRQAAGGCPECSEEIEQPCVGSCISKLPLPKLTEVWNNVAADMNTYPNYGIPGSGGIFLASGGSFCIDLAGGDSSWKSPVQLWTCNGLVRAAEPTARTCHCAPCPLHPLSS